MGWAIGGIGAWAAVALGVGWVGGATVEVEEAVARCGPANNGAGPYWCYGSPLIVRVGDEVFASVMEVGEGVAPLCNTRWRVFRRDGEGWSEYAKPEGFREREPCPIVASGDGRLLVSVNPSTEPPGTQYGKCDPHLIALDAGAEGGIGEAIRPGWEGEPSFSDHSYRGIGADRTGGGILVLNIDKETSAQHWAFGTASGGFGRHGAIEFPIRSCYPQVALRGNEAHVMAIGDIVEPNAEWAAYKKETTGSAWDYVFRRLFYAHAPDLAEGGFSEPIEVASVEETGGHITNLDLWLDEEGDAHLLYLATTTVPALRDRFFPDEPIVTAMEYAVVSGGQVVDRCSLLVGGEGRTMTPQYGRFHATPGGRRFVVASVRVDDRGGSSRLENRLIPIGRDAGEPIVLDLEEPLGMFFTATERGGSAPSDVIDLLGSGSDWGEIRYARIRVE